MTFVIYFTEQFRQTGGITRVEEGGGIRQWLQIGIHTWFLEGYFFLDPNVFGMLVYVPLAGLESLLLFTTS